MNLLKTDPTYLETIARDRLDLMKEGETIFRLESRAAKRRREVVAGSLALEAFMLFAHGQRSSGNRPSGIEIAHERIAEVSLTFPNFKDS